MSLPSLPPFVGARHAVGGGERTLQLGSRLRIDPGKCECKKPP
ncbi:MAG TPA: hypothetical protein VMV49_14995 [Candidatus Deferrimicrobium sp.]|nr:hypothetical protein [Candidatus Deferrimicrobium sp.]